MKKHKKFELYDNALKPTVIPKADNPGFYLGTTFLTLAHI